MILHRDPSVSKLAVLRHRRDKDRTETDIVKLKLACEMIFVIIIAHKTIPIVIFQSDSFGSWDVKQSG